MGGGVRRHVYAQPVATSGDRRQTAAQTRRALIDATRRLMHTAPDASNLTVRAIAEEAGLQFSLVTRHFGTRDALLRTAALELLVDWAGAIEAVEPARAAHAAFDFVLDAGVDITRLPLALASADQPVALPAAHPAALALTRQLERLDSPVDRTQIAMALALMLGWARLEDRWSDFTDLDREDARGRVHAAIDLLLDAVPPRADRRRSTTPRP